MKQFKVWYPEHGDEDGAQIFSAHHAEGAAQKWAEDEDSGSADYWIVGGETPVVYVRCLDDGKLTAYRVSAEQHIIYFSTEVNIKEETKS